MTLKEKAEILGINMQEEGGSIRCIEGIPEFEGKYDDDERFEWCCESWGNASCSYCWDLKFEEKSEER